MRHRLCVTAGALALSLLLPLAAGGQTCQPVKEGEELKAPPEIPRTPIGGYFQVATTLDVQEKTFCIPTSNDGKGNWTTTPMKLRTYVYPNPSNPQQLIWGLPGPTLRVRKSEGTTQGYSLKILLKNSLPFPTSHDCNSACAAGVTCDCKNPDFVKNLIPKCMVEQDLIPECCCVYQCTQQMPNCQHADNVTNLHFHGSHVSPQSPQDFVLLDLYPPKPTGAPAAEHIASAHGDAGKVAYGQFQYYIPSFPPNQPEGTHWYHPHRHGSTSLQVGNGLAGALLIEGAFDDWLKQFYQDEKLFVAQAITDTSRLGAGAGQVLVNGQIKPKITVKPNEVQRWRIINATMNSRTLLRITLPDGLEFRQIAMDGIRFSPINYECQPLLNFDSSTPSFPCNSKPPAGKPTINLAPGNRADFLVRIPSQETRKGTEGMRFEGVMLDLQVDPSEQSPPKSPGSQEGPAPSAAPAPVPLEEPLFTMVIDDGIEGNDDQPKLLGADVAALPPPAVWPPMPPYLAEIKDSELAGQNIDMKFQQFLVNSETQQWPYAGYPLSTFKIDSRQFQSDCANITTALGAAKQWNVANATLLRHPFHIHTNPFQVFSVKGVPVRATGQTKPEPFWLDTLMLPTATVEPKLPKDVKDFSQIKINEASMTIRQRYEDFTGAYVLHCHILGHEDRGMMLSVQTVCGEHSRPEAKGKFGNPTFDPNGECVAGAPYFGPLDTCK